MFTISKTKGVVRKIFPFLILTTMLIAPMSIIAQTNNNYPASTSITFISYQGDDANGILAFEYGQIAFYAQSLPPSEISTLPLGAKAYEFPSTYYYILVNPLNTTFGFNPFQFQQVRFALNYIVNRTYFVDDILHSYGMPAISVYSGQPAELHILPTLAKYADIHYNFTYANETIYKVLTAHGAQYVNGQWYYDGKPITVYVFVTTGTTVREAYTEYLISQFEKLGFTVQEISGNSLREEAYIDGSNPATTEWDIVVASSSTFGFPHGFLPAYFYSTILGSSPFTSYFGLSFGAFNDTKYESMHLLNEANEISKLALVIFGTKFTSAQQYYNTLNEIVNLGIKMAVKIGLGLSLSPIYVQSNVKGIYPSFPQSTILSFQTYLAIMNSTYPNITIGVRYLSQGAADPAGGYTDQYTNEIAMALFAPTALNPPGVKHYIPYIYTYKIVNISPHAVIPVPSNALWWNPEKQEITYVPPNTTAKMTVIYNFAPLINNDKWADGQPITLADFIYQYVIASEIAMNSSNPIYDPVDAGHATNLKQIKGFKIINSTAIEIWGNEWFFDPNYAAYKLIDIPVYGLLGLGLHQAGFYPWQEYAAMKYVVAHREAAWTEATAEARHISWLNLLNPKDVNYILSALENASAHDYIPKSLLEVENLSGVTLVTPQEAEVGYQDAINFIKTYGNGIIGDGPFILVAWNPSASPPYAKIVKSPYFHLTPPPQAMVEPTLYSISFTPPATVSPGQTLSGTVMGTPDGSTVSVLATGVDVTLILESHNGATLRIYNLTTDSDGQFTFSLPSSLTPGAYTVLLVAYSNTTVLVNPVTASLVVVPSVTTTTSTTTVQPTTSTVTSTSTTTSISTKTSFNTTEIAIIAIVVILVIVVAAVVIARRK